MIHRIVVANQKGGVAKTTTAATLGRCFADRGMKTLLLDTDPQGSLAMIYGARPEKKLYHFVAQQLALAECTVQLCPNLHLLASDRKTLQAEAHISAMPAREFVLRHLVRPLDEAEGYEVVIVDVSPSISLLQACAAIYAGNVLIPIDMDVQAVQGAIAVVETNLILTKVVSELDPIRTLGFLPVRTDARIAMTRTTLNTIDALAKKYDTKVFHSIRTDASVQKSARGSQFLQDYAPKSKVMEDYNEAFEELLQVLGIPSTAGQGTVDTENVLEASTT